MTSIGIYHPDLNRGGGSESVTYNIYDALSNQYDVELITGSIPDENRLNNLFGPSLNLEFRLLPWYGKAASKDIQKGYKLRHAISARSLERISSEYDCIISGYNEIPDIENKISYIHHPIYLCQEFPEHRSGRLSNWYDKGCRMVSGYSNLNEETIVTNSQWSSSILDNCKAGDIDVVYPPVDTSSLSNINWENQENGIVAVGRVSSDKRVDEIIDIYSHLNERGMLDKCHIIGRIPSNRYGQKILDRAKKIDSLNIHGEVAQSTLYEILAKNKYGIHARENEHFGMAVAEMVGSGMLPFVHKSGGQVEIVNEIDYLTYTGKTDAVENISEVISDTRLQKKLLAELPECESNFGKKRFDESIKNIVDNHL
ncbi:glycosyltransferase involved in cell wall biosynthesis [Haloarcula quadrata]|uniref:Glycosyltransferase involved in cell wall biosynthesis n=1 Tax=Haloarcula quadrata TaxID=182779 RepID=A0A495R7F9_9EURY|nr:glycosyltransferase [Haloarcula quadrata]RKS83243.1 glycosyltransferase involved in cell wall biosynthesis [Haloarcula quadrata]